MSVAFQLPTTVQEFLAWEERGKRCAGSSNAHETIGGTLRALLYDRLKGKRCRVRGPTLKIEVAGRIRYPDAFVFCTPAPGNVTVIKDPVVVFEVLGPGTSRIDRIDKLREYRATKSIRRYVILEPDSIAATVQRRSDRPAAGRRRPVGDAGNRGRHPAV
jgi:Uma2 family endonuclease